MIYSLSIITASYIIGRSIPCRKLTRIFQPLARNLILNTCAKSIEFIRQIIYSRQDDKNHLEKLYWGFVPFRAKDTTVASRMINARSETVATKHSFRTAFKNRRCLILADGFYEWAGKAGQKQPMFLTLPNGKPFAFAGLWKTWDNQGKKQIPYRSATILTREASESVMPIHNRMPVILKPEAFDLWLDRKKQDVRLLQDLLQKQVYTRLKSVPVSKQVNSVKVNRPGNIKPVETKPEG